MLPLVPVNARSVGVLLAVGIIVGVLSLLWPQLEKRMVFFPHSEVLYTPADLGIDYEDVFFTTGAGLKLHGWFVPAPRARHGSSPGWLWFHGNGGNIGHRVEELALLRHRLRSDIFLFDYRGYGQSQGTPSEAGTYRDARAALAYLEDRGDLDTGRVIYFGHSLGASVAVELATVRPPKGLVLVSPPSSIRDMADLTPIFRPFTWLVRGHYDSNVRIGRVDTPLLVLHGDLDQLVPIEQGRKLFEAANEPKRFVTLRGAAHNDTYIVTQEELVAALAQFKTEVS